MASNVARDRPVRSIQAPAPIIVVHAVDASAVASAANTSMASGSGSLQPAVARRQEEAEGAGGAEIVEQVGRELTRRLDLLGPGGDRRAERPDGRQHIGRGEGGHRCGAHRCVSHGRSIGASAA